VNDLKTKNPDHYFKAKKYFVLILILLYQKLQISPRYQMLML